MCFALTSLHCNNKPNITRFIGRRQQSRFRESWESNSLKAATRLQGGGFESQLARMSIDKVCVALIIQVRICDFLFSIVEKNLRNRWCNVELTSKAWFGMNKIKLSIKVSLAPLWSLLSMHFYLIKKWEELNQNLLKYLLQFLLKKINKNLH